MWIGGTINLTELKKWKTSKRTSIKKINFKHAITPRGPDKPDSKFTMIHGHKGAPHASLFGSTKKAKKELNTIEYSQKEGES
jgi:aspartyl-tRNA synthetase